MADDVHRGSTERTRERAELLRRRRFLSLALGGAGSTLAGCAGDDSDGTTESSPEPTDQNRSGSPDSGGTSEPEPSVADAYFETLFWRFSLNLVNWNPTVGYFYPGTIRGVFAQWTQYLVGEDRFHPHLVEDWTHGEGELRLQLSESFTWGRSGERITAEDLAFQLEVYRAGDHPATRFVDSARAEGEDELVVGYPSDLDPSLIEYSLLASLADVPPADWREADWRDDPTAVTVHDPDPSGPLTVRRLESHLEFDVRRGDGDLAEHHLASQYDWAGYRLVSPIGESTAHDYLIASDVDGVTSLFVTDETSEQLPDTVREITIPAAFGMALWFDHDREPWGDRRVREAFLHSLDREGIIDAVGARAKLHHPAPTGLSAATLDSWFGTRTPEWATVYEQDLRRAETLLADAGYDPTDREISIAYPQGWSDWAVAAFSAVDQLSATWSVTGDAHQVGPREIAEEGEFDVVAYPILLADPPAAYHPFFALERVFEGDPDAEGHFANYDPGVVDVGGERVDPIAELDRLRTAGDRATARPIARRLARVVNETVPCAIVMEKRQQSFIDAERWAVPEESPHLRSRWPQYWLPKVEESLAGAAEPGLLKYDAG